LILIGSEGVFLMKLNYAGFLAALVVLVGVSAGPARATVRTVVPDPSCITSAPSLIPVSDVGGFGVAVLNQSIPGIDACLDVTNNLGFNVNVLAFLITPPFDTIPETCTVSGGGFQGCKVFAAGTWNSGDDLTWGLGSWSPSNLDEVVVDFCISNCITFQNGATAFITTPEPEESLLLLLGVGLSLSFLGLAGLKSRKLVASS
jgi:hypothetical protein